MTKCIDTVNAVPVTDDLKEFTGPEREILRNDQTRAWGGLSAADRKLFLRAMAYGADLEWFDSQGRWSPSYSAGRELHLSYRVDPRWKPPGPAERQMMQDRKVLVELKNQHRIGIFPDDTMLERLIGYLDKLSFER